MRAGTRDRRIRIEYQSATQDPVYGTDIVAWVPLATVWANIQDILPSKAEKAEDGIRVATRPTRIRLNYRADLRSDMRVVVVDRPEQRVLRIVAGPAELGRKEGLEIVCEDYSTQGDGA